MTELLPFTGRNIGLPALPERGDRLSAIDVEKIEAALIAALPIVESIEDADEWRRKAKGIEAYLRSPELQRPMLGAQRHIEAKIGELLGPAEFYHDRTSVNPLIPNKDDRANFRLLARALAGDCELTADEWRKSRRALVALIRQRLGLLPETPALPEGKFSCIVADPPWQQTTGPDVFHGTGERGNQPLAYCTLSVEQIANLKDVNGRPVQACVADDAHLYLWTINRYVEQTYAIARAWGFKPSALLTWCKSVRGVGLGDTFRQTSEFILFCRRGNLTAADIVPTTWFQWPRGRHSAKPDEFYKLVESVTPGTAEGPESRLDLFARKKRNRWQCWGDEVSDD
jgi:N6-adenosine-specific RNA methylase IME4